ncbi:hypothetical protein BH10BDE1_BH10BDE1_13260 [soil metagenome]
MVSRFFSLFVVTILAGVFTTGCASMSRDGSVQTMLIQTVPPGASIFVGGEKIGQSPELVEIRRSRSPQISVATKSGLREVELDSKYRWSQSFWRNCVFYLFAPIGWLIDFGTGTAWENIEPSPIQVELSADDVKHPKPLRNPEEVAIAPPRSSSVAMSDEGGRSLERNLRAEGRRKIRPYDETLSTFVFHDFEYGTMKLNDRRRLQKALDVDVIYESYVEPDSEGWVLKTEGHDVYSPGRIPGPILRVERDGQGPRVLGVGLGLRPWWSRILPDTIGLDFVDDKLSVELQQQTFAVNPVIGDEWWSQGLRYISAINISSTPDRRREYGSRWEFSAVPALRFSRREVEISNLPPPTNGTLIEKDPRFTRWNITAGYGLEIGYLNGRHYFYFDLIPVFNWSQISWRQSGQGRSATRTAMLGQSELGYTYVFDSNWLIRIFSRSQAENNEIWRDALAARLGDDYSPTAVAGVLSGLTLGYRFDVDHYVARSTEGK